MTSHYAQRAWIHSGPACPPLVTGFGCSFSVPWCPGPFQFPPPLPTLQPLPTFTQGSYPLIYSNISPLLPGVLVQEGSQSNISEQGRQWLCPQWTNNTKALSLSGDQGQSGSRTPGAPPQQSTHHGQRGSCCALQSSPWPREPTGTALKTSPEC